MSKLLVILLLLLLLGGCSVQKQSANREASEYARLVEKESGAAYPGVLDWTEKGGQ